MTKNKMFLVILFFIALFVQISFAQFMIVGHRGAAGHAPENTLISIQKAIELGATHIEVDLHQSSDGIVVVIHDYSVNRTTNGSGKVIDFTLEELKKLDAGSWFDEKYKGEQIPTLIEVLHSVKLKDSIQIILEVKGDTDKYPGISKNIIKIVDSLKMSERVIYKSFNKDILDQFKSLSPKTPRLLVTWNPFVRSVGYHAKYIQPHRLILTQTHLNDAHEKNHQVIVWDIHTAEKMKHYLKMGVDGIETDYPDRLKKVLLDEFQTK